MRKRIAVIGCGRAATQLHIPSYQGREDCEVVAVCDTNVLLAREMAIKHGISSVHYSPQDLFENEKLDIISICSPPQTHAKIVECAANYGVAILLEKPIAGTIDDAMRIFQLTTKLKLRFSVVHNYMFAPGMKAMFAAIQEARIGQPLFATKSWTTNSTDRMIAMPDHWAQSLPGGRWTEAMPHHLYIALRIFPTLKLESMHVGKIHESSLLPADQVVIILSTANAWFTVEMSTSDGIRYGIMNVMGTKGTISATFQEAWIRNNETDQQWHSLMEQPKRVSLAKNAPHDVSGHREFIDHFMQYVEGKANNPTHEHDAIETMRLTHEIGIGIDRLCGKRI